MSTEDQEERARFETAIGAAWMLWHAGLSAASVFNLLGELLRRTQPDPKGARIRVFIGEKSVTVLPDKPHG